MRCKLAHPLPLSKIIRMAGLDAPRREGCLLAIATDSKEVEEGDLFLSFAKEREAERRYLKEALDRGAAAAISESVYDDERIYSVSDIRRLLSQLAVDHVCRIPHRTVAITGSVGKTTTRVYLEAVLGVAHRVTAATENHNTEISVPLTMLEMSRGSDCLLLEMGMRRRGEIEQLSLLARPDLAIITRIGSSHMETLGSKEEILRAKLEITAGMSASGTLFYSADDPMLALCGRLPYHTFGVSLRHAEGEYALCQTSRQGLSRYELRCPSRRIADLTLKDTGNASLYAAAFAGAVADRLGMSDEEIRRGLARATMPTLRQTRIEKKGILFLADCYNASPESMEEAFSRLKTIRETEGRRIHALLGDMRELGKDEIAMHRAVGASLAELRPTTLITCGALGAEIAVGALRHGMDQDAIRCFSAEERDMLSSCLASILQPGDCLLLKASRALAFETVLSSVLSMLS